MKKSWFLFPLNKIAYLLPLIIFIISIIGWWWISYSPIWKRIREGMNSMNNEYTYKNSKKEVEFKINDVTQESVDMLNCLKIDYLGLIDVSKAEMTKGYPDREYDIIISNTQLYKESEKIMDSSRQDLDKQWSKYFMANKLTPDIYTSFYEKMLPYSRDYYRIHSYTIRDNSENITEFTLVNYLMELMRKSRTSQTKLDKIKNWIMDLFIPAETHLKIIQKYANNKSAFHANHDLQFVINKTAKTITELDFEKMAHTEDKGILYVFAEETGKTDGDQSIAENEKKDWELNHPQYVSVDGMTMYSSAMIMNNLYSIMKEKIEFVKFKNMYSEYLTREVKPRSAIIDIIEDYM